MDEARVLKCCGSVIRSKGKQELVDIGGKINAITGRGNHPTLGIETDGNDNAAAWFDAAASVGNDHFTGELTTLIEMTFQPSR